MNFLTLADLSGGRDTYLKLIQRGIELKQLLKDKGHSPQILAGKSIILLFEKPSTRTRISFEIGISQLGGTVIFISGQDSQMSRGEPIKDTATIMSSMADGIIIRNNSHQKMCEFAQYSNVPIVNALSSDFHPCQLLADIMTYQELHGPIQGKKVVWCGDGNNMCNTYIQAAALMDFQLVIATPEALLPNSEFIGKYSKYLNITQDMHSAMQGADLVCTDVWVSMGDKDADAKRQALRPYQVTSELLSLAATDVLFMHCLPAKEGEEIEMGLLDHPQSGVWVQGENRLHAQKALLELLYSD